MQAIDFFAITVILLYMHSYTVPKEFPTHELFPGSMETFPVVPGNFWPGKISCSTGKFFSVLREAVYNQIFPEVL
jgi:hypothetical protein